jgi:hypothetical protein
MSSRQTARSVGNRLAGGGPPMQRECRSRFPAGAWQRNVAPAPNHSYMVPMASGLPFAHIIDLVAHDPATDEVALVMTEDRRWTGGAPQLFQLQEKINAYLSFALDGEMAEAYPQFQRKLVRLQLDTVFPLSHDAEAMIDVVRRQIAFQGLRFEVRVTGEACNSSSSCGCHN